MKTKHMNLVVFFLSNFGDSKPPNSLLFRIFNFLISLFGEIPPEKKTKRERLLPLPWRLCASDCARAAKFPLSRGTRGCFWSHCCRSRACEEPSQVAAVVGEEEQAFSEFLPAVGFLQCFTGLVASSPGWSGTRIWLPLNCNTSTTRGLVCLTKKERFFFFCFCVFLCLRNLASQELFQKASYSWVGGGWPFRSAPLCSKDHHHHHVVRVLRVVVFLFLFLSTFLFSVFQFLWSSPSLI